MMNSFNVIDCVGEKYKPENHRENFIWCSFFTLLHFIIKRENLS